MRRPQTSPPQAPPPAPPAGSRVEPGSDVVSFLDAAGLGVYSPVFFSHGYTSLDSLYCLRPEDLLRMQLRPGHQKKLLAALDSYRSTGQITVAADSLTHPQGPQSMGTSYQQQMLPGALGASPLQGNLGLGGTSPEAMLNSGIGSGLGPHGYGQPAMHSPYQKGSGLWADTATPQEAGYQWVDDPCANGPPSASAAYPVDQSAVGSQTGRSPAGGSTPGSLPMYYPQAAQWSDNQGGQAVQQPVQQDMVFQWFDSPAQGRLQAHQQHYLQAPIVSPYYQGIDSPSYGLPHRGLMDGSVSQRHGLDLLRSPPSQAGYSGGQALPDATRYQPPQDVLGSVGGYDAQRQAIEQQHLGAAYGHHPHLPPPPLGQPPPPQQASPYHQPRPPHGLQMEDSAVHRMVPYGTDMAAAYQQPQALGSNSGSYQLFDHPPRRSPGSSQQQGRQRGPSRGARGQQGAVEDSGSRRNRQVAAPAGRQDAQQQPSRSQDTQSVVPELGPENLQATLISTLESLYEDRIKPLANYVKGRLKERQCPEPLIKNFVELYAQQTDVFIVQRPADASDEAVILLCTEPQWFKGWVDIDSPDDPYDEETWEAFARFLDGEHTFAGGRYGMARELMQRNLGFLANYSLGEVCHIVQLAIQSRRLVVYHRKMLKPIQTVLCQLSTGNGAGVGMEGEDIKDMDDLCFVLFRMLMHHPQGLRLCRLKQMIKHEFCRKLSEMSFQCTKLIELFNTEPLAGTFVLDTENDGKSIYVRLGNQENFTEPVKRIYSMATSAEAKAASQVA